MNSWRRRFTRNVLLFALGLQVPVGVLLTALLARAVGAAPALALTVVIVCAAHAPLVWRLRNWREDKRNHALHVWLADVPFFVHFCASLVYAPLAYLALLVVHLAWLVGVIAPAPSVVAYLGPLYLAALVVGAYAALYRRFWTPVRDVEVRVANLPEAFEGYTLVQLSDLHCGPYLPRWFYRRLARRASSMGADMVVVTGDMITSGLGYIDDVRDFTAGLRAPDGVFACMGNHDYFGATSEVADAMRDGGARVLLNEGATVAREGDGAGSSGIYIAGIDDTWSKRDDLDRALAARPAGMPCVLLAHDPGAYPKIKARGDVDLVLSGHSHAGQFAVPFVWRRWNLARLRERHTAGFYREGTTALYVHAGNGTSGPAARLGAAPEIARIVLRRA